MVQFKVVTKGLDLTQVAATLKKDVRELKREMLTGMANEIADLSRPTIDSGYYAASHEVRLRSGSFTANKEKPPGTRTIRKDGSPEIANAQEVGRNNMLDDIAKIDLSKDTFAFRNPMLYAGLVEREHGYEVYSTAKRSVNNMIQDAIQKARSRP